MSRTRAWISVPKQSAKLRSKAARSRGWGTAASTISCTGPGTDNRFAETLVRGLNASQDPTAGFAVFDDLGSQGGVQSGTAAHVSLPMPVSPKMASVVAVAASLSMCCAACHRVHTCQPADLTVIFVSFTIAAVSTAKQSDRQATRRGSGYVTSKGSTQASRKWHHCTRNERQLRAED